MWLVMVHVGPWRSKLAARLKEKPVVAGASVIGEEVCWSFGGEGCWTKGMAAAAEE